MTTIFSTILIIRLIKKMYVRNTYETIPFVKLLLNEKQNGSLTKDQRVFVVNYWYETKSCVAVQGLFRQRF